MRAVMVSLVVWAVVVPLVGCASLEGPAVDLHALAQPEPAAVPAPAPPSLPSLTTGEGWRVWVPRQAGADGSVSEGHWVEIAQHGPTPQLAEPRLTIPRPPKVGFQKPRKSHAPRKGLLPSGDGPASAAGPEHGAASGPAPGLEIPSSLGGPSR